MKTIAPVLALAVLTLVPAERAMARDHDDCCPSFSLNGCDAPAHWMHRHDDDTRFAITTRGGEVTLLLTGRDVAIQLSDKTMRKVDRRMRDERDDGDDNSLRNVIEDAVFSSVRSVLDHSMNYPIRDMDRVEYTNGRLELYGENGRRVFHRVDVHDEDMMTCFSERDARAFVREFRNAKARIH